MEGQHSTQGAAPRSLAAIRADLRTAAGDLARRDALMEELRQAADAARPDGGGFRADV